MTGITRAGRWRLVSRLIGIGLIVMGSGVLDSRPAAASPIKGSHHRYEAAHADPAVAHSWSAYLLAGPRVWSSQFHPRVTPEVQTSIWRALRTDSAQTNAWVNFLLWKQSLNPARFARFHPHVVPVLHRISTTSLASQVTPTTTTPSTSTPLTQAQTLTPTVPEPGPWLLALGMTGWGLWWRRRQGWTR